VPNAPPVKRGVERAAALALVLLAHLFLLWAWRFVAPPEPRQRGPSAAPNITLLRLIPATPAPQSAPQRRAAAPPSAATPTARSNKPPPTTPEAPGAAVPQAITVLAATEPAASAPTTPASRTLELAVPRATAAEPPRTMKDQALNDPRANSPRPTVESRVANVSGTTTMTEERMDDTKTRFRQNGGCIEVHVSRDAQTHPWNQNHSPTPKLIKPSC
jgi:cytoskeletal protein RodZ